VRFLSESYNVPAGYEKKQQKKEVGKCNVVFFLFKFALSRYIYIYIYARFKVMLVSNPIGDRNWTPGRQP
jgi:hypothetical protein